MLQELQKVHEGLLSFMTAHLDTQGLNQRTFYAEAFLLAWLKKTGRLSSKVEALLLKHYQQKDQDDISFHFEFNHFGIWEYLKHGGTESFSSDFEKLQFRGTSCANWSLLRALVKYKVKHNPSALKEMKEVIAHFQINTGLILDEKQVNSFQYHCFSMSLILEMYLESGDDFFKDHFLSALTFISRLIMPNGESLYVGRGQNQIFGYGPLIWSLIHGYKLTKNSLWLSQAKAVLNHLGKHQHDNGRFSLVVTNLEERFEGDIDLFDKKRYGWYAYNNLFDYLAFLGFYLNRCLSEISQLEEINTSEFVPGNYKDERFEVRVHDSYIAVIARPGGAWTNDLPVPFIFHRRLNCSITPFYGGEQFQKSPYDLSALPYPILKFGNWHIRKRGFPYNISQGWLWFSFAGIFSRQFAFDSHQITVKSRLISLPIFKDRFYLPTDSHKISECVVETDELRVEFQRPVCNVGVRYSAKGPMTGWESKQINNKVVFKIL